MAIDLVGLQSVDHHLTRIFNHIDYEISVVSAFKRSGHARFRRASANHHQPSQSQSQSFSSISLNLAENLEGSVSNGKQVSSLGIVAPTPSFSSRKPPLPSSHRKRNAGDQFSSACHCCKRRKTGSKREVRRIPITGSKVDSIPADDYSWKKYGEKKVVGSPLPRVYYKCNSSKGCPARKRVELSGTDSKMLLVTYDREHHHHHAPPTPFPVNMTGLQI